MKTSISYFQLNIKIDNKAIKQIHVCKSLGVVIDEHLTSNNNTNNICKKVTAGISALRRLKECADKHTLLSVFYAHIYTHISNIVVKYGMYLVKHNPNACKNYTIHCKKS